MINKNKVILMTRLAAYENGVGKKYLKTGRYFRGDYISSQLIKSFICGTISYLAIVIVIAFYNFELFMSDIYATDLVEFGKSQGKTYLICIGAYLVATYILAIYRYRRSRRSLKAYNAFLSRLSRFDE